MGDLPTAQRTARLAITFLLAALAASAGIETPANAATINTFQGECTGVPGTARWPLSSLRTIPTPLRMVGTFEGGSCSGTLNGARIDGVPLRDGYLDVYGPMGCPAGVADGRA